MISGDHLDSGHPGVFRVSEQTENDMENFYNTYNTISESFVSADGKVIRFADVMRGIDGCIGSYTHSKGCAMSDEQCKDIRQQSALKAWRLRERYDSSKSAPATWGSMIAKSCIMNAFDSEMRRKARFCSLDDLVGNGMTEDYTSELGYQGNERLADGQLRQDELMEFVYGLTDSHSDVDTIIVTMVMEGYSNKEIANSLGLSVEATTTRICRIRKYIKRALSGMYATDDDFGY